MPNRQEILEEIKRTTIQNGGTPLGILKFEKETGITEWKKFWPRFGDAQKEAGLAANKFTSAYSDELLIEKLVGLARKLGKFPTGEEIRVEHHVNTNFPDLSVFEHRGSKQELVKKVIAHCINQPDLDDVLSMCESVLKKPIQSEEKIEDASKNQRLGEVYLFKSGRFYKIGKTFDTVRRGGELRIQLPEELDLIHSIKTDDPSGVEAYWHRRFDSKRKNGEWFDLNTSEIRAFKLWKRIS